MSAEGGFSVELPGTPAKLTQEQPVGEIVLEVVLYNLEIGQDVAYQVAYVDYPDSLGELDPEGVLRGAAGGAAGAVGGTLTGTERLEYRGHPAISFDIELEGAHIAARSLLVGRRLYTLQAVSVEPPAPAFEQMIESFRLTG